MMSTKALLAALLVAGIPGSPFAQVVDFDPIPGLEQPANRHQYYSSHNSHLITSLALQLDLINVWEIELDVHYVNEGQPSGLDKYQVFHTCADDTDELPLKLAMDQIKATQRFQDGLFFLNIQPGPAPGTLGIFGCDDWEDLTTFNHDVNVDNIITSKLGIEKIYTNADFLADGQVWPSVQELVRRGKRVVVHVRYQSPNYNPVNTSLKFLKRSSGLDSSLAFWNSDDENASFMDLGDKHMARYYPSDSICESIFEPGNWNDAINSGFNFPATNCVDVSDDFLEQLDRFHPPYPMYAISTFSSFGIGTALAELSGASGVLNAIQTWVQHYNGLFPLSPSHTSRAGIIPILMSSGTYDFSGSGGVIDGPVILQSRFGTPVTLN